MCSFTVLLRQHHLHWIWRKKEHINTRNSFISAQREFLYIFFFSFLLHRWEGRLFFSFSFFMNTSTRESDNKAVRADTVWMCVDAALKKSQCLSPLYLPRLLSREGVALWNIHEALTRHRVWRSLPGQRLSSVCFLPECTLTYVWFSRADLLGDLGERWITLEGQMKLPVSVGSPPANLSDWYPCGYIWCFCYKCLG